MLWCESFMTFDLISARIFFTATFDTFSSYHKALQISANNYKASHEGLLFVTRENSYGKGLAAPAFSKGRS